MVSTASLRSAHMHCFLVYPQLCRQQESLKDETLRKSKRPGKAAGDVHNVAAWINEKWVLEGNEKSVLALLFMAAGSCASHDRAGSGRNAWKTRSCGKSRPWARPLMMWTMWPPGSIRAERLRRRLRQRPGQRPSKLLKP